VSAEHPRLILGFADVDAATAALTSDQNGSDSMPMIDVYACAGTFHDKHALAQRVAATVMAIEEVPNIPMFRETPRPSSMSFPPTRSLT
jgi:hypothetical protein